MYQKKKRKEEAPGSHKVWKKSWRGGKWRERYPKFMYEIPDSGLSGTYMERRHSIGFEN